MKTWSWQKWVGKLVPAVIGVGGIVWSVIEMSPQWWPMATGLGTLIVQWIVASFPNKASI